MQFLFFIICFLILYFDAKKHLIYDKLLILLLFTMGRPHLRSMIIFLCIYLFDCLIRKSGQEILGFGDIKLFFVLINNYAYEEYIQFLGITFLSAACFSFFLLLLGAKKEEEIPLGSFMMMAVFLLAIKK